MGFKLVCHASVSPSDLGPLVQIPSSTTEATGGAEEEEEETMEADHAYSFLEAFLAATTDSIIRGRLGIS